MKLKNRTKWNSEDLRKLIERCIKEAGYESEGKIIEILTGRFWTWHQYSGRASINGNWVRMKVPNIIHTETIKGDDGTFQKVEALTEFNKINFAQVLIHELGHNAGLQHEDMLGCNEIEVPWVNEYAVRPQEPKPKIKKDLPKERYDNILEKIKRHKSKLKRTQTILKKLYKRKKYYEKMRDVGLSPTPRLGFEPRTPA